MFVKRTMNIGVSQGNFFNYIFLDLCKKFATTEVKSIKVHKQHTYNSKDAMTAMQVIQCNFNSLQKWSRERMIHLSPDKTKIISIRPNNNKHRQFKNNLMK